MSSAPQHPEHHNIRRLGWLRAAVLGANDGIVSVASVVLGVAAGGANGHTVLLAGIAALVAGAFSMAAGEYVSVSSQSDIERADLAMERAELAAHPEAEQAELKQIYIRRGLDASLAAEVAAQLSRQNALEAHARDELGLSDLTAARPLQAAQASAAAFAVGAALPVAVVILAPHWLVLPAVGGGVLVGLILIGVLSARAGGAPTGRSIARVTLWGALAMAVTTLVGSIFGIKIY